MDPYEDYYKEKQRRADEVLPLMGKIMIIFMMVAVFFSIVTSVIKAIAG